jgi:hypothetical protein
MTGRPSKLPLLAFGLTLSGLFLFVAIRDQLGKSDPGARGAVPTPASAVDLVGGWRGPASLAAEGLDLIFAPLHTDPVRQSYDARILGERLELGKGAPFRLEVHATKKSQIAPLLAAARAGELLVEDTTGRAAELLASRAEHAPRGAQPIAHLFSAEATLDPESGGRLVFWGRPPIRGAVLVGPDFTWPLTPSSVPRADLPLFVASRSSTAAPRSL